VAETLATSRGGGPSDNPRPARWLPVGVMFALALTGGAVLAWLQVKTDKEFQLRAYRMCLIILEQLANVDPGWQGAVSIAHEWTGEVLQDQGKLNEALASPDDFRFLEVLRTRCAHHEPFRV
jgi:hypothetical protein